MRDVRIGRVKGNVSISDSSGSGGGGFEVIAAVAGLVFVVALVAAVAHAIAAAVAAIVIALLWSVFGLLMAAALGGITYVALRLHRGQPLRRMDRAGRVSVIRSGRPAEITDARPGQLPARLHPDDLTAIASDLANRLRGPK